MIGVFSILLIPIAILLGWAVQAAGWWVVAKTAEKTKINIWVVIAALYLTLHLIFVK